VNPTQKSRLFWMAIFLGVIGLVVSGWRAFHRPAKPTDLSQGGVQLTYDVDIHRVPDLRFARSLDRVVSALRQAGVTVVRVAPQPHQALIAAPGLDAARLTAAIGDTGLAAGPIAADGEVTLRLPDELARTVEDAAMQQTARVLHDRLEKLDWAIPQVRETEGRITITLPGLEAGKLERVKEILAVGGRLEFREVDAGAILAAAPLPDGSPVRRQVDHWSSPTGEASANVLEGPLAELEKVRSTLTLPGGIDALIEAPGDPAPARLYLVSRRADVTGELLKDARAVEDRDAHGWRIDVEFDDTGAAAFRDLSTRLIGKKLAIVLDDRVQSAPVVMTTIGGGRAQITLGRTGDPARQRRTAENLALALRSGALPAPLRFSAERIIGPAK
jgi:protein-export membrane protein SecD